MKAVNVFWRWALASAVVLGLGCSSPLYLNLYNHAETDLTIYVEGRTYQFPKNSQVTVKYPKSQTIKIAAGDVAWAYTVASAPRRYESPLWAGSSEFEIYCQIEPDGRIYILIPKTVIPTSSLPPQPADFPLVPVKSGGVVK